MNLSIFYKNSGLKKDTSKDMKHLISAMEPILLSYLKKNRHFAGVKNIIFTITLCGKVKIQKMNKLHRKIDKVTDVLSFPLYENLRPDKKKRMRLLPHVDLGDLIICKEKAFSQAREFEITYEEEIIHLSIHGFLHLLGFDHEISRKEEKIMEHNEEFLVKEIYKNLNPKK